MHRDDDTEMYFTPRERLAMDAGWAFDSKHSLWHHPEVDEAYFEAIDIPLTRPFPLPRRAA